MGKKFVDVDFDVSELEEKSVDLGNTEYEFSVEFEVDPRLVFCRSCGKANIIPATPLANLLKPKCVECDRSLV